MPAVDTVQIQPNAQVDPSKPADGVVTQNQDTTRVTVNSDAKPEVKTPENTIPEKFRTADGKLDTEKLLASYGELEKKIGGDKKESPATTPEIKTPEVPQGLTKGDLDKLSEEFRTNGKLSDETFKSLEAKGITRDIAENYIAGQTARAEQYANTLREHVGGKDSLDSIIEWAGANLTDAEIKTANTALSSGDLAQAKLALDGLKSRFTAANGTQPNLVNGAESARSTGVQPFRSNDELVEAMRDPRYRTNKSYRKDVEKRLAVTP